MGKDNFEVGGINGRIIIKYIVNKRFDVKQS